MSDTSMPQEARQTHHVRLPLRDSEDDLMPRQVQVLEISHAKLNEVVRKIEQARLGKKEIFKVLDALDRPDGPTEIESWFNRRRDTANGMVYALLATVGVVWVGIATMTTSTEGIPVGDYGLSAYISCLVLLAGCIAAIFYYAKRADSLDRKRERAAAILDFYREP
jgi:hypothetical protein